jgi:hypothetical protein
MSSLFESSNLIRDGVAMKGILRDYAPGGQMVDSARLSSCQPSDISPPSGIKRFHFGPSYKTWQEC